MANFLSGISTTTANAKSGLCCEWVYSVGVTTGQSGGIPNLWRTPANVSSRIIRSATWVEFKSRNYTNTAIPTATLPTTRTAPTTPVCPSGADHITTAWTSAGAAIRAGTIPTLRNHYPRGIDPEPRASFVQPGTAVNIHFRVLRSCSRSSS
jgi:hypothetical protein